ncbi:MAG: hypothetical protein E6Q97_28185 [Desulfurellales bacterium]|nr:MAG: hypothetical protein E6Q97_28185 [Desulfurellales bacterium]
MKRIVAFDLGSNFAMATVIDGALHTEKITRTSDQLREHWLGQVMGYVAGVCDQIKPELVFYERPFARGQAATRMGWGLAGVIEAVASQANIPVLDMPPATIKKWATGKGNATKEEMTETAQFMYGYAGEDEHEADAVCALYYADANSETVEKEIDDVEGEDDGRGDRPADEGDGEAQQQRDGGSDGAGPVKRDDAANAHRGKSPRTNSRKPAGGRSGKTAGRAAGGKGKNKRA